MDAGETLGAGFALAAGSFTAYVAGVLAVIPTESDRMRSALRTLRPWQDEATEAAYQQFIARNTLRCREASSALLPSSRPPEEIEEAAKLPVTDLRANLLLSDAQAYGEFDRLAAEGSFRVNVPLPIASIVAYLGVTVSAYWLLAMLALPVLLRQGAARLNMSVAVLQRAAIQGVAPHPLVDIANRLDKDARDELEQARHLAVWGEVPELDLADMVEFVGAEKIEWAVHIQNNNDDTEVRVVSFDQRVRIVNPDGTPAVDTPIAGGMPVFGPIVLAPHEHKEYKTSGGARFSFKGEVRAVVDVSVDFIDGAGRQWNMNFDGSLTRAVANARLK